MSSLLILAITFLSAGISGMAVFLFLTRKTGEGDRADLRRIAREYAAESDRQRRSQPVREFRRLGDGR